MMKFKNIIGCFLFMILLISGQTFAQTIALRAGNLIDPATGTASQNQIILVKDGKITDVGPNVKILPGTEIIDLSQAWVLPGLMDAHAHLTLNFQYLGAGLEGIYLKESTAMRALHGLHTAMNVLHVGFTTVRDVGNDANYAAIDLRDAINIGWFTGPTILTTGKIIAPFGGQSRRIPPEQGPFWLHEYIDADGEDEIRKAVRQNIYYGADAIKMVADNSAFYYSEQEIRVAVEEAHAAGLPVSVHVMEGEAARNVILGGADSIEHGFTLSDELLQLMKEKGTVLVGTDFPADHLARLDPSGEFIESAKEMGNKIIDRLKRAHKIGVKLVFGTDTVANLPGKNRGEMMLDYLAIWEAAGIPPTDTLRAMTVDAARFLQVEKMRGAIAKGLAADIIATTENPLDDLQALRKLMFVMKNGKVFRHDR
ncbi:MAG: amidohydrolase family protein [Candidatus Aminicenantes bacterium]|nr:MAG: amidohydrolase family protein [Candidatus Aminicenantes bacterium]